MKFFLEKLWLELVSHKKITIITNENPTEKTTLKTLILKEVIVANHPNPEIKINKFVAPKGFKKFNDSIEVDKDFFKQSQSIVIDPNGLPKFNGKKINPRESIKIGEGLEESWKIEASEDFSIIHLAMSLKLNLSPRCKEALNILISLYEKNGLSDEIVDFAESLKPETN